MSVWDRERRGQALEGYAFTFCKAGLLVLIFQRWSLLALSGLCVIFYVAAQLHGVKRWRCWAKPPWVTIFWVLVFCSQVWIWVVHPRDLPFPRIW